MAAGNSFYYSPIILIANTFLIVHYVAGMALSISHTLAHFVLPIIQGSNEDRVPFYNSGN